MNFMIFSGSSFEQVGIRASWDYQYRAYQRMFIRRETEFTCTDAEEIDNSIIVGSAICVLPCIEDIPFVDTFRSSL